MRQLLQNKVALVTGGSSGIGRAATLAFAREGARVVVADINSAGGAETVRMIEAAGGEATFVTVDVTQSGQVKAMVDKAIKTYGRLDCAFNNAGISHPRGGSIVDCPEDVWDETLAVNLKGVWLCMKYEIPPMLERGGGAIVNTASIAGLVGQLGSSAYNASKHGVLGLTKAGALTYAQGGVRINAVCPGFVRTPMVEKGLNDPAINAQIVALHPLGRVGAPEEVSEAAVWLCSEAASFVTGHALAVDGGYVAQ